MLNFQSMFAIAENGVQNTPAATTIKNWSITQTARHATTRTPNLTRMKNTPSQSVTPAISAAGTPTPTIPKWKQYSSKSITPATALPQNKILRLQTLEWRLDWWLKIVHYTFAGPYFWLGKGYGINLSQSDGIQAANNPDLRSPHNAFMTVLARSGVPGLLLWLAFLVILFLQAARMISVRPTRPDRLIVAWVAIYLLALLFNSCFDVFLEGPMGGIWFWSMAGVIMLCSSSRGETGDAVPQTNPDVSENRC